MTLAARANKMRISLYASQWDVCNLNYMMLVVCNLTIQTNLKKMSKLQGILDCSSAFIGVCLLNIRARDCVVTHIVGS